MSRLYKAQVHCQCLLFLLKELNVKLIGNSCFKKTDYVLPVNLDLTLLCYTLYIATTVRWLYLFCIISIRYVALYSTLWTTYVHRLPPQCAVSSIRVWIVSVLNAPYVRNWLLSKKVLKLNYLKTMFCILSELTMSLFFVIFNYKSEISNKIRYRII